MSLTGSFVPHVAWSSCTNVPNGISDRQCSNFHRKKYFRKDMWVLYEKEAKRSLACSCSLLFPFYLILFCFGWSPRFLLLFMEPICTEHTHTLFSFCGKEATQVMTHVKCCWVPCCEHKQQIPAASRFLHGGPCESYGGSGGSEDFWWLRWQTHCPACQLPTLRWKLLAPWCLWYTENQKWL